MYTPSPWKTNRNYSYVFRDEGNHDGAICRMAYAESAIQWVCEPASLENSANARLIAAAPELYETLRVIVAEICEYNPTAIPLSDAITLLARVSGMDTSSAVRPNTAST